MNCKHFAIRSKKNVSYKYCRLQRKIIDSCSNCEMREYKTYKQLKTTKSINEYKFKKHKLTKYTEIPLKIKKEVWERDNHKCIFCGKEVPLECANSHYIKRSQLGLGIVENTMTNCYGCHDKYDNSVLRKIMKPKAREYLRSKHEDWNEENLVYKK